MSFHFRPAIREQTPLLIGLGGPSGSGKTASALKLARGILGNDEGIFFIDTEAGRARYYACAPGEQPGPFRFRFQHCDLTAPFSPERYLEAIEAAVSAGAKLVVVDSMSHAHEGEGGMLEGHERELARMAGDDYQKRERMKFAAWIRPKAASNRLVNAILQKRCQLIFTFRAKDKLALVKGRDGKTEPVSVGWTPICSDRFEYEMTTLLMLPPNARGVPDLESPATKINEHHRAFFKPGQPLTEQDGEQLAAWACGGAKPSRLDRIDASPPGAGGADVTARSEAPDERAALLAEIDRIARELKLSKEDRLTGWKTYAGAATRETADETSLSDLLTWLRTRQGSAA